MHSIEKNRTETSQRKLTPTVLKQKQNTQNLEKNAILIQEYIKPLNLLTGSMLSSLPVMCSCSLRSMEPRFFRPPSSSSRSGLQRGMISYIRGSTIFLLPPKVNGSEYTVQGFFQRHG